MRNYKSATFQPTIRPDWAGILSYISESEKAEILVAIIKYPSIECESAFWKETIKPDLDNQFDNFKNTCEAKARGVRERWGKISITQAKTSTTYVIDAEREREREGEGIEESGSGSGSGSEEERILEKSVKEIIKKTAQGFKMRPMETIQVTQDLVFPPDQFFDAYRQQLPDATARAEQWLRRSNMVGKTITLQKIGEIIQKFEKNKKQKNT